MFRAELFIRNIQMVMKNGTNIIKMEEKYTINFLMEMEMNFGITGKVHLYIRKVQMVLKHFINIILKVKEFIKKIQMAQRFGMMKMVK